MRGKNEKSADEPKISNRINERKNSLNYEILTEENQELK